MTLETIDLCKVFRLTVALNNPYHSYEDISYHLLSASCDPLHTLFLRLTSLEGRLLLFRYFADKKTEGQRDYVIWPRW